MARPNRPTGWVLLVGFALLRILQIFARLLWRLLLAIFLFFRTFGRALWNNRIIAAVLVVLFGVGFVMQEFEGEIKTGLDILYECGIYPLVQITASVLNLVIALPYEFVAPIWNELMLFLFDLTIGALTQDLRTLVRAGRVTSVPAGLSAAGAYILGDEIGDFTQVIVEILNTIGEYLAGLGVWFTDVLTYVVEVVGVFFIEISVFGRSCSLCSADLVPSCDLRKPYLPGQTEFDCDECHELVADAFGLIGQFFDAVTANFVASLSQGTSFKRIGRAIGCLIRSLYMYPVQIVQALIQIAANDECLSFFEIITDLEDGLVARWFLAGTVNCVNQPQVCCGKPAGCTLFDGDSDDLPIGILGCLTELIRALTDDAITDFVALILAFIFAIVDQVVRTVDRTIVCFSTTAFQACLPNYPASGNSPGTCAYDLNLPGAEKIFPTGGIHECFGIADACLATNTAFEAPLLVGLVGPGTVFNFILTDLLRFSIDFAVCPFAVLPQCFPPEFTETTCGSLGGHSAPFDSIDGAICSFDCVRDTNPVFGLFFGFLADVLDGLIDFIVVAFNVVEEIQDTLNDIAGVFECVLDCDLDEVAEGSLFKCFDIDAPNSEKCDEPLPGALASRGATAAVPDTPAKLATWVKFVDTKFKVPQGSFCGDILRASSPKAVSRTNRGSYMAYFGCHSMYVASTALGQRCQLSWPVDSPGKLMQAMSSCNLAPNATRRARRPPSAPLFNLTLTRTGATASSGGNSSWWYKLGAGMANVTNWQVNQDIVQPLWQSFKQTGLFHRTVEFYDGHRAMRTDLGLEPTGSPRALVLKQRMDDLYVDYANDVLSLYRTRKWRNDTTAPSFLPPANNGNETETESESESSADEIARTTTQYLGNDGVTVYTDASAASMRALPGIMRAKMEYLHILEPPARGGVTDAELHAHLSPATRQTWAVLNGATHLEYQPWFQKTAGVVRALRRRDVPTAVRVLRGRAAYHASRDQFVTPKVFEQRTPEAARASGLTASGQPYPTIAGKIFGTNTWNARMPRKYAPFPIPMDTLPPHDTGAGPHWTVRMGKVMQSAHAREKAVREARRGDPSPAARQHQSAKADFDATQGLIDFFESIVSHVASVFGSTETSVSGLFTSLGESLEAFFADFDFQDFSNVEEKLAAFFTCAIPENIDGESAYSPFCILLAYEKAFAAFALVTGTTGDFPPQIPWPEGTISSPCVSQYAGSPQIFEPFEFSDNCILSPTVTQMATCDDGGGSQCTGAVALTIANAGSSRSVIRYTVDQGVAGASATCPVETIVLPVPKCAAINNVNGSCVTDFDADVSGSAAEQGCAPEIEVAPVFSNRMRVNVSFALGGVCVFDVSYSTNVVFSAAATTVALAGAGEPLCTNCSIKLPAAQCGGSGPLDPFPDQRPLCDGNDCGASCFEGGCDYCKREYGGCAAAGFSDVLDTFLYLTAILPVVGDEILFGGFDVRILEMWIGATVVLVLWFLSLPTMFVIVGIFFYLFSAGIAYLITWAMFIFFDGVIPWPIMFAALSIYVAVRSPGAVELTALIAAITISPGIPIAARLALIIIAPTANWKDAKEYLAPVFAIIGLVIAVWIMSLVFTFPSLVETVNINQALSDILLVIDDNFFLAFIDVTGVRARVDEFIISNPNDITPEMTHCFWWNLRDLALLMFLGLFGFTFVALFGRWFLAPVLAVIDAFVLAVQIWVRSRLRVRLASMEDEIDSIKDDVGDLDDDAEELGEALEESASRISAMRRRVSLGIQTVKMRILRKLVGEDVIDDYDDDNNASAATARATAKRRAQNRGLPPRLPGPRTASRDRRRHRHHSGVLHLDLDGRRTTTALADDDADGTDNAPTADSGTSGGDTDDGDNNAADSGPSSVMTLRQRRHPQQQQHHSHSPDRRTGTILSLGGYNPSDMDDTWGGG